MLIYESEPGRWPVFAGTSFHGRQWDHHLVFVVIAPAPLEALAAIGRATSWDAASEAEEDGEDPDTVEPCSSWWVQRGTAEHHALIGIEPDPPTDRIEAAVAALGVPGYVMVLTGWDDPDDGFPGITRVEGGEKREVWTAAMSEEEEIEILTLGDESLREWAMELIRKGEAQRDPSITGPWALARSLGVELPAYRAHDDAPPAAGDRENE